MTELKNSDVENPRTPNNFFCTFELSKASKMLIQRGSIDLFDHKIKLKQPKSPSDILWANMGIGTRNQCIRQTVFLIICIILTASSVFGWFITMFDWVLYYRQSIGIPDIDCDNVLS